MQMLLGSTDAVIPPVPDVFNLIGSLAVPRQKINEQLDASNLSANVAWLMGCVDVPSESITKGEIQQAGYSGGGPWTGLGPIPDPFPLGSPPQFLSIDQSSLGVWVLPHDFSNTYYVRATLGSGDPPTSGSGLDTWLSLVSEGANRSWIWTQSSTPGTQEGTIKLEISDDAGGSNIVATGFYKARATVNP